MRNTTAFALARRLGVVALGALAAFGLTGCFDSNTVTCSSGLVCPAGSTCTADGLGCTTTECGNRNVDTGEECDDGNQKDDDRCHNDCKLNVCGDGVRDVEDTTDVEECDTAGDSATCDDDCTLPRCGDNHTNATFTPAGAPRAEVCDDGNTVSGDQCSDNCASRETCGDGYVNDDPELPSALSNPGMCAGESDVARPGCREACDTVNPDGTANPNCTANCQSEKRCGDFITDRTIGEVCDDGNTLSGDQCSSDCRLSGAGCGNNIVDSAAGEQCDTGLGVDTGGNPIDTAACIDCKVSICGDGVRNPLSGEDCDPGAVGANTATCNSNCKTADCGDGIVNPTHIPATGTMGEVCDDDNIDDGDGCSHLCQLETCGNGLHEPTNGEGCDDGNAVDTDGCRNNCQVPRCGDGIASASEVCDDNGFSPTCDDDCSMPECGDGRLNLMFIPAGETTGEQCDDDNVVAGDGCSPTCRIETCGNGLHEATNGEACDDGNSVNTDGCRNDCRLPACGDGVPSASETCDTSDALGANRNSQTCDDDCSLPVCGDGRLNPAFTPSGAPGPEQCDDNGTVGGDGCSALCQIEPFALSVAKGGTGAGTVNGTGISCGADCTELFPINTSVTLTAAPTAGSVFTGWSGACTGVSTCVVTMSQARNVVATFQLNTLTVARDGTGSGTVGSSPAGITCPGDCTQDYNAAQVVVLTATANAADSSFVGWTGDCIVAGATCTTTMNGAKTITATFALLPRTLTVAKTGTGLGTVSSSVGTIACGATCSDSYPHGTVVTLAATPNSNNTFTGWTGACTGTGPCTVTMDAAKSVTATFTLNIHLLTVVKAGAGSGTVTSDIGGIACGGTCSASYDAGTSVVLTGVASAGSTFMGWSGGSCAGTTPCTVSMTTAKSVTATFALQTFALSVTISGSAGTVTSTPAGITCTTGTCSTSFNAGALVTLVADGGGTSTFTGWSGTGAPVTCTTAATCVVTMDVARSLTASFASSTRTLSVTRSGTGGGTVTSTPGSLNCGSTCTAPFAHNTSVTLTAMPDANSDFIGWTGSCTGASCTLSMNSDKLVNAEFRLKQVAVGVTVTNTGGAGGTISSVPNGLSCTTGTCTVNFPATSVLGLVALPDANSVFTGWTGACVSATGPVCTLTVPAPGPVTVGATFAPAQRTLIVTKGGAGTGTVTGTGINCDLANTDCTETYNHGTSVTLTAAAGSGATFVGWSGAGITCPGTTCVVLMDAARTVTATFAVQQFALNLTKGGTGTGTVTSNPAGISCGTACPSATANFNSGAVVVLTPVPSGTSSFSGWSGACTGTGDCVVTMSAIRNVTANFATITFALTVDVVQATTTGTVTSAPGGITACAGLGCVASFTTGQSVVLTATLGTATAVTWGTGDCDSQTLTTCTVAMTAARAVDATFTP